MEGEQKLCLVEPTLELGEKTLLQVQMQLMEEMEDGEALAAEAVLEEVEELVLHLPLLFIQQEMEVAAELVVMEAEVDAEAVEGALCLVATILQEWEVQEVLVVLEAAAEAAEAAGILTKEVEVVMVLQEVMAEAAEVEAEADLVMEALLEALAALVALD